MENSSQSIAHFVASLVQVKSVILLVGKGTVGVILSTSCHFIGAEQPTSRMEATICGLRVIFICVGTLESLWRPLQNYMPCTPSWIFCFGRSRVRPWHVGMCVLKRLPSKPNVLSGLEITDLKFCSHSHAIRVLHIWRGHYLIECYKTRFFRMMTP